MTSPVKADTDEAYKRFPQDDALGGATRYGFLEGIRHERQRCAAIADLYVSQARPLGSEDVGDCPLTAHYDGQKLVAENIAHDIRKGL